MNEPAKVKQFRYTMGNIAPVDTDKLPNSQPEPLLPPDIRRISVPLDIADYTPEGVEEAIRERYWQRVDELVKDGADSIVLNGIPVASQLGRRRVLELLEETRRRTGLVADSHAEAVIAAMRHLGMRRIAIASRWSDALNSKLVAYLAEGGIEVLTVTSVGQWAQQAFSMSIEEGVKLAFLLSREAMQKAPDADGLLLPGGAWRSLAAVPILEEDFGKPVVTNPIAAVWRMIDAGVAPPVQGWGRLLANQ